MNLQSVKKVLNQFFPGFALPADLRNFIHFYKKVWPLDSAVLADKNAPEILMDSFGLYEAEIARAYFANVLSAQHKAKINSFSKKAGSHKLRALYKSFGVQKHILTLPTADQKKRALTQFALIKAQPYSKQAIHDLHVYGAWVGVEIYEEYLSRFSQPTIDFQDPNFWDVLLEGLELVEFWRDYFQEKRVKAIIVSHDCYLAYGLICKVAYQFSIPVYLVYPTYITRTHKPFSRFDYFHRYPEIFAKLPPEKQSAGKELAKKQLERRFSGEVGVDMSYSTKSAYVRTGNEARVLAQSDRLKVLICSHCFFDSPHAYGELLFPDFYEWMHFLGKISERTNYDWYLKTHPDPLPGTVEVIQKILAKYPKIKLLPNTVSHLQLVDEGIGYVLTVYGSVGHEYPWMGKHVINAGLNPHIAYDFNQHPKSVEEYEKILLNLDKLPPFQLNKDAFFEFYYIHHYGCDIDDLIFSSYTEMTKNLSRSDRSSAVVLKYFQSNFSESQHQKALGNLQEYLASGRQHTFEK